MEDGPHLLCTGSPQVLPFKDNKGQNTANYLKEKDVTAGGGNCHTPYMGGLTQTLGS